MSEINIDCRNLTKDQINEEIVNKTTGLNDINLTIDNYEYYDFEGLILPNTNTVNSSYNIANSLIKFNCSNNHITSFAGLTLPAGATYFNCSNNLIRSFAGLKLPNSLIELNCSGNQITSFTGLILNSSLTTFLCSFNKIVSFESTDGGAGLKLPSSLQNFYCSGNQITSFAKLTLPNAGAVGGSLIEFDCSGNKIKSFDGLTLPESLTGFDCSDNKITIIENFVFPFNLIRLAIDNEVKFVNPKFNSVLEYTLENKVEFRNQEFPSNKLNYDELIFLYFNFKFMNYQTCNHILNSILSI
jgi:hypothetical protein